MVNIDGNSLTIKDVVNVSRFKEKISLSDSAKSKVVKSREFVDDVIRSGASVYGITTGFGELANKYIDPKNAAQLQINLVRSHAAGVGTPLEEETVRAMMLLRINALAKGYSGVTLNLLNTMTDMVNKNIYPYIPCQGSVGASGDLAPLAHLALTVIGEGECFVDGNRVNSADVLKSHDIQPVKLSAKEGLGLTNGTQLMAALGCLTLESAKLLMKNAQIAAGMSLEALKGTAKAFDEKIHLLRPHNGQIKVAENMRNIVSNSDIISSHKNCQKVQDAYTLRCIPQVYGAVSDTIDFVEKTLSIEINSATDNPLIFPEQNEAISGGNFHGEPLAFAMDYLGIAISEIGNISERTIDRLVNPYKSGLPPFLSTNDGLNSGFMVAQYTAASLVSENKVLSHPASVDSVPTSAGQEDHVSMGPISARHAKAIIKNVENVLAVEMIAAAQGIDFWDEKPGIGSSIAHQIIRQHIPFLDEDRALYKDIDTARQLINSGAIVNEVEKLIKIK